MCKIAFPLSPEQVIEEEVTDSTNERAKQLWDTDIRLILAAHQTAGRGSRGRSFYSPPHVGLYMSYLYHAPVPTERLLRLTPLAAVAVRRSLADQGISAGIKWVNDLFLNGKKICGILTVPHFRSQQDGSSICDGAVIGIGLNLLAQDFPPAIASIATSVEAETGIRLAPRQTAEQIVCHLHSLLGADSDRVAMAEYRSASVLLGKAVTVRQAGIPPFRAIVQTIDEDGGLCIVRKGGQTDVLRAGEVSLSLPSPSDMQSIN